MGTSLLPPLFKYFNDDISVGGGIKISKPVTVSTTRPKPEVRIEHHERNRGLVITYDSNVRDRYGLAIANLKADQHHNTVLNLSMTGHDNFVNLLKNTLNCTFVVVKQSEYLNLTSRSTILLLESLGTNVLFTLSSEPESETVVGPVVNQPNDNRSVHNKSRLYFETVFKYDITATLTNHDTYVDLTTKQSYRLYGPMKYDAVCVLNDDNLTQVSMKRSFFVHGVFDVSLRPVRTDGVQTGVNTDDSVVLGWSSSQHFLVNVHAVQLHDHEGNVLVDLSGNTDHYVVSLTELNDYRGAIRAYVQYENVSWSPLNYSNTVVFETTNKPVRIEFKVSNDERFEVSYEQLYVQLVVLDMGSSGSTSVLQRAVTLRFYEDEARQIPAGDTVTFVNLFDAHLVGNLEMGTGYYISYETDDQLNPTYADVIDAKYSTRADPTMVMDGAGPVIEFTVETNPLMFSAVITDSSYIVNVRYSLFSDLDVETVNTFQHWFPIPLVEFKNEVRVDHQQMFVYYLDNTNIQPYYTMTTTVAALKFVLQATDIYNNVTTRSAVINLN